MQIKKIMALATVTAALFAGVGFMNTAEAAFGVKMPKIGNVIKGGSNESLGVNQSKTVVDVTVTDANGNTIKGDWYLYQIDTPNPKVDVDGQKAVCHAKGRMVGRFTNKATYTTPALDGNPVNLMVFVRNYGWYCQQVKGTNAKGELKLAVTPNCPGLWNMTLDAFN